MAVEAKRGCGYRRIGGTYLVGGGIGRPCDRLPLALDVCPTCGHGIKYARGWTWVDVAALVQGPHMERDIQGENDPLEPCPESERCVFCGHPESMGRAGLLWIGEQFYKTPADFLTEGVALGFSRRIKAVPRGFKVGETWVLLAHIKAAPCEVKMTPEQLNEWKAGNPQASLDGGKTFQSLVKPFPLYDYKPGIFYVWKPTRIERIMRESERDSEEAADFVKRGITPVFVPDDDPDHGGGSKQEKLLEEE